MKRLIALLLYACLLGGWTHGVGQSNQAPTGFNLGGLTTSQEQPFLNVIHNGQFWGANATPIAITNVSAGAVDTASGTGTISSTTLTLTAVSQGTFRKNQTVTGTGVTASSVIIAGNDCASAAAGPCVFTLSQPSTVGSAVMMSGAGNLVRISMASNAPIISATLTASISNDLDVGNYNTAATASISGTNILTISGPASGIAGTWGFQHCGGGNNQICIVQALTTTSGSIPANTSIIGDSSTLMAAVNAGGTGYGVSVSGQMSWSGAGCTFNPVLNVTTNGSGNIASVTSVQNPGLCATIPSSSATTWTPSGGLSAGSAATFTLTSPCGSASCTGGGGTGTYALNNTATYSGSIQSSTNLTTLLHVTGITGHLNQGMYLSGANVDTTVYGGKYGAYQAIQGGTGIYYACDAHCSQQTLGSTTILASGVSFSVNSVMGPTEANSCTSAIPVTGGTSFDCATVDYSGTAWGGGGTVNIRYGEYDFAFSLDASGYPQSMTGVGLASMVTMQEYDFPVLGCSGINDSSGNDCTGQTAPFYPSGQYLAQYLGGNGGCGGSIAFGGDASCAMTVIQGTDVLNVVPSAGGISVRINNITGGYVHGLSLVYCGTYLAVPVGGSHCTTGYDLLLANGEMLNPVFVAKMKVGSTIRFMDYLATNGNQQVNWTDRPLTSQIFWHQIASPNQNYPLPSGTPIEVMIAIMNEAHVDGWFNMGALVTDSYISSFATLVHSNLTWPARVYIENSNEVWNECNGSNPTYRYQMIAAFAEFPNYSNSCNAVENRDEIVRPMQARSLWKTAWGADANRVFGVIAGQGGNNGTCAYGAFNCVVLQFQPGQYGSNIATQWTAYGLRTDTASSTSSTITGSTLTVGGTVTGTFQAGQQIFGNNVHDSSVIIASLGGGQFSLTNVSTGVSAETITASTISANNTDMLATGVYTTLCGNVSVPPTFTVNDYFTEMNTGGLIAGDCSGGWLAFALAQAVADIGTANGFNMPSVSYELGQQFIANGTGTSQAALTALFAAATRDARMGTVFTNLLTSLKTNGRALNNYFVGTAPVSAFGEFTALENINQTGAVTYNAIVNFNQANPCWWGSLAPWVNAGGCGR
jgi:hypothetical protein